MKIALIYLGRRGSGGPVSLALGRALVGRGAKVTAYLSASLENLPAWTSAPLGLQVTPTFANALEAAWTLLLAGRIRRLAQKIAAWGPDALVFPRFHPWNAPLQARLAQVPSLVFVQAPASHPGLAGWLNARLEDSSLKQAAGCFVLSESLAPGLARRGVAPERIAVIPHGPLPYPHPGRNGKPHPPTLLFFGRITAYKGLEVLFQAFESLQAAHPDLRLLVAGHGSLAPYRRWLERLQNVELVNRWIKEEEIAGIFNRATLLVLPYTGASQSGVLAIAAAFGLPVVTTRAGGLPEQVCDCETGLLVSPGSPGELAQAIERLLADPLLARRLGAGLKLDFELRRSWDEAAGRILRAAASLLGGRSRP